jgi:catechol 2,3-dioxygenase-like lactoylglutathione lyase family enzyme
MAHGLLGNNKMVQVGIIVRDIEKAAADYAEFFGIDRPKAHLTDAYESTEAEYKGKPTRARAKLAFMDFGSLQVELIEPDEHQSTWREFLDEHGEGIHHIAFVIDGMKDRVATLSGKGFALDQKGEYTGGRYAYIDTRDTLKTIVELLEND